VIYHRRSLGSEKCLIVAFPFLFVWRRRCGLYEGRLSDRGNTLDRFVYGNSLYNHLSIEVLRRGYNHTVSRYKIVFMDEMSNLETVVDLLSGAPPFPSQAEQKSERKKEHTTAGIRGWSPTPLLISRSPA
jgi:hypothetical protein